MILKIVNMRLFSSRHLFIVCSLLCAFTVLSEKEKEQPAAATEKNADQEGAYEDSIWDSYPIEIYDVNIQILDKISGKIFRRNIKTNESIKFGNISLKLKRCFKNSPEDSKEIYAYIEVYENKRKIFSNWKFASHQSVNLMEHPVYDIKVEF
ncbi:hypothetical protein FACS1894122_03300 [Alphaproteobacteria bacterium]|nr:hypothetical protein FACS1894122_03300 [Alphaproteobacteria bacterium]